MNSTSGPQPWHEIRTLFRRALEHETVDRSAFLDRECPEGGAVRREVSQLLGSLREAGEFLEPPPTVDALVGKKVDSYRLLNRIGEGGMGVVYLAERSDDAYRKEVAIKVLGPDGDREELSRRFMAERQILATLEHPHIARLLDGGTTSAGLPYLVMEYVEGQPIDEYCRSHELSIRARLELFRDVCAAVQFAHQNLVIHRDLKPGNILVTDDGAVKLLDFGIAKILQGDGPDSPFKQMHTATGFSVMTPLYASPEQVKNEAITTASDVYSLGLVLFELLSGHRPYRLENDSYAELVQAICDLDPAPPSELAGAGDRRRLVGDLDAIVMKALRKEPDRRYSSVEQLAQDLGRHLCGRPVHARRLTFFYRWSRFISRNRWPVVAASLLVIAFFLFAFANHQKVQITWERDRATMVTDFIIELFESSDPFARVSPGEGGQASARDILDAGARSLHAELAGEPELQGMLMATVGVIYERLGLFDLAAPLLESAVDKSRRLYGPEHPRFARDLFYLARLRRSEGQLSEATRLVQDAVRIQRQALPANAPEIGDSLALLGALYLEADQLEQAESLLLEALAIRRPLAGGARGAPSREAARDVAETLNDLGSLHQKKAEFESAEMRFLGAQRLRLAAFGGDGDHPDLADSLNRLASLYFDQAQWGKAEQLYRQSLASSRRTLGEEHPHTGERLSNVAAALHMQGDFNVALDFYRQALAVFRQSLGDQHPMVATTLYNLANLHHHLGELHEAERLFRESLEDRRNLYAGGDHSDVAESLDHLGLLLWKKGELDEAGDLLREALAMWRRLLKPDHPRLAFTTGYLARFYLGRGQAAEAEPLARESMEILEKRLPQEANQALAKDRLDKAKVVLANALVELGKFEEAESNLISALPLERARRSLIDLYEATGQVEQAAAQRRLLGTVELS